MSEIKTVSIDTNFATHNKNEPAMSDLEIRLLGLTEGQRVVAYQDDDEWDGIVRYDSSEPEGRQWYIELD